MRDGTASDGARNASRAPGEDDDLGIVLEGPASEGAAPETCPYCRSSLSGSARVAYCRGCHTPHHRECWQENGGCTTYGCRGAPRPRDIPSWRAELEEAVAPLAPVPLPLRPEQPPSRRRHAGRQRQRIAEALALANLAILSTAAGGLGLVIGGGRILLGLCVIGIVLADRALCRAKHAGEGADAVGQRALWAIGLAAFFLLMELGIYLNPAILPGG